MFSFRNKIKYLNLFAKVALVAFIFAWITCTSHISLTSLVSQTKAVEHHGQSDESPLAHNENCIDHTQFSVRPENDSYHSDFSFLPTTTDSVDFSFPVIALRGNVLHLSDFDTRERLFLENTVLRL